MASQIAPQISQLTPQVAPQGETDPLANLRDIHLPPDINQWPPAPGWWLLGALALAVAGYGIYLVYRYWLGRRYRREALKSLQQLRAEFDIDKCEQGYLTGFNDLLKRTALTGYPREWVASLTGEAWVSFLDKTLASHEFSMGHGQVLIDGNYQTDVKIDVDALNELGKHWIKNHSQKIKESAA